MKTLLKQTLQAEIFTQMEAAYPNEAGGFLLGTLENESVLVEDVIQVENIFEKSEQYHRYAMTPLDWARLEDEAETREMALIGYYHSHPESPAIPSTYDRDHALPNFTYIITSVQKGKAVDIRAWRLRDDRTQFDPATLTIV